MKPYNEIGDDNKEQTFSYEMEDLNESFREIYGDIKGDTNAEAYLDNLEENTPEDIDDIKEFDSLDEYMDDLTEDEIEEIWDNDPGYLNELSFKQLPGGKETEDHKVLDINSAYMRIGSHMDYGNWGNDAVKGTEKNVTLEKGKILERYGGESGSYFSEPGTKFDNLHLNVSEDKLELHTYEILKEFDVKKSIIEDQPFDEKNDYDETVQYKSNMPVEDLIELGFIREIKSEEE